MHQAAGHIGAIARFQNEAVAGFADRMLARLEPLAAVGGLDRLIVMKLTAFRDKDRTHLRDMIDVGLIDAATVGRLPEPLRGRLEQLLANPDG